MKVENASWSDVDNFSGHVVEYVLSSDVEYKKVCVVGVRSGGVPLAKAVYKKLAEQCDSVYSEILCQRPSTKTKNRFFVDKFLVYIPVFLLDWLRILEHHVLSHRRASERVVQGFDLNTLIGCDAVLVVDDAIDSGESMSEVLKYFESNFLGAKLIAAYVVTQSNPAVLPDYCECTNVLIRFPWSKDAKNNCM